MRQTRQRDILPSEIDWVFCWRTTTGELRPGSRDSGPIRYSPTGTRADAGLITVVKGRPRPSRKLGFLLNDQGAISRRGIFLWGYVTFPHVIPARNRSELEVLRNAAHEAVASGEAHEWALAAVHTRTRAQRAIHLDAPEAVVRRIAASVQSPWVLDIREKDKGAEIVFRDLEGRELATLAGNTWFDKAPVPSVGPQESRPVIGSDFWEGDVEG